MATYLIVFALSIIFIFDGLKDVLAVKNVRFTKNATFDGFKCTADQTVVNAEEVESKVVCTSMCSKLQSCFGVFYHPVAKDCIGCSFYMDANAPARNGTVFHRRKGNIPETSFLNVCATHHADDVITFSEWGTNSLKKLNWNDAKEHCIEHLAYIKSLHEQEFVDKLINQANLGFIVVWIGASDILTEGTFMWGDGTTLSGPYTNWGTGQPNNANNQDCAHLIKENGKWTWNDAPCSSADLSLCEFN